MIFPLTRYVLKSNHRTDNRTKNIFGTRFTCVSFLFFFHLTYQRICEVSLTRQYLINTQRHNRVC